jgi:DNA-binding NtrC family response regulator
MVRVIVQAPGDAEGRRIDIGPDDPVLIGRNPDPHQLARADGDTPPGREPRPLTVASPSVSANHVIAWVEDGTACFRDVGSRHGSWLRLPRRDTVRVRTDDPLWLELALASREDRTPTPSPDDAHWKDASDYAAGVARAVDVWLRRLSVSASVQVARRSAPDAKDAGRIPLAYDRELAVSATGTLDGRWPETLAAIWKYVSRQNLIFEAEEETRQEGLILASDAMRRAHRAVVEAAQRGLRSLLLVGSSGSGKEGLARCFHRHAGRDGAFVARNCAMFNKEFLRAELFGAEAGSFTGCVSRIVGAVERAHGGTLLLDELGEMNVDVQPMLLRFLDRGEYEPMGHYGATRHADVRVVGATSKDLRAASRSGQFRPDLWYRLSVQLVEVPPLSERYEDIAAYLKVRQLEDGLSAFVALDDAAHELVRTHLWEGNFRELANFVDRLPRVSRPGAIGADDCRRALDLGSLAPPKRTTPVVAAGSAAGVGVDRDGWARLALLAVDAFGEDHGKPAPSSWDEVKEYVEKYLKPLLFAHLGGVTGAARDDVDIQAVAKALDSDRGTATRQVARYIERFSR